MFVYNQIHGDSTKQKRCRVCSLLLDVSILGMIDSIRSNCFILIGDGVRHWLIETKFIINNTMYLWIYVYIYVCVCMCACFPSPHQTKRVQHILDHIGKFV